jgi:hypothetical protein
MTVLDQGHFNTDLLETRLCLRSERHLNLWGPGKLPCAVSRDGHLKDTPSARNWPVSQRLDQGRVCAGSERVGTRGKSSNQQAARET